MEISFHTVQTSARGFNYTRIIPCKWELITLLAQMFSSYYSWSCKVRSQGLTLHSEPKQAGFRWPWDLDFSVLLNLADWMLNLAHFVFFLPRITTNLYPLGHIISPLSSLGKSLPHFNILEYLTRVRGFQGDWMSQCLLYCEISGPYFTKVSVMIVIVSWHFSCQQAVY